MLKKESVTYLSGTAVDERVEEGHDGSLQVDLEAVVIGAVVVTYWKLADDTLSKKKKLRFYQSW